MNQSELEIIKKLREAGETTDEDFEKLVAKDKMDVHLKNAEDRRKNIEAEFKYPIEEVRYLCKNNLYFFVKFILGYGKLSENYHFDFCSWRDRMRGEAQRFMMNLQPRGHYKTTTETIGGSIQAALPDDDKSAPWPYCLGTDIRTLIGHETLGMASVILYEITNQLTSNELLMALYPEIVPNPRHQRINRFNLELPRTSHWKETTFSTMGVGGKSQGYHFNLLQLDDLIGDKARDSETEMATAKLWIDNIQAFFSDFAKDVMVISGTRYANDDLYEHIMERYGDTIKIYHRSVEEDDGSGVKKPVFPEGGFNEKTLAVLKKNKKVFMAQYMNDPDGGATAFEPDWIKSFEWQDDRLITVFQADIYNPSKQVKRAIKVDDLFKCLLWDPAVSGLSGYTLTGTDDKNRTFVLTGEEREMSPPEAINKMFEYYYKWQFDVLVIEEVLFSELFRHWLQTEFQVRGVRFAINPVTTKQKAKDARVAGLSTFLSAGQLFFNEKYYSRGRDKLGKDSDLIWQIKKFGSIKNYHVLDALAYGPEAWKPGFPREKVQLWQEAERQKLQARMSASGYSKIKYGTR